MPNFDVNSAVSFLKGYLSEQERQKAEKKIQKAMESGDWEITQQIEPQSGKQVYQLKSRPQISPLGQQLLDLITRGQQGGGGLGNEVGFTGASIEPSSGEVRINVGETPAARRLAEERQLTADQKNAIAATQNSLQILKHIKQKLSQKNLQGKYIYPTGGIIPSYRYSSAPLAGYVMGQRGRPGETSLNADMRQLQAEFIKAQTGAQRGFKEMSFLLPALPMLDVQTNEKALEVATAAEERMENYLNQMTKRGIGQSTEIQTSDPLEGKTATNPKTGQKLIRKGGQWIPM